MGANIEKYNNKDEGSVELALTSCEKYDTEEGMKNLIIIDILFVNRSALLPKTLSG